MRAARGDYFILGTGSFFMDMHAFRMNFRTIVTIIEESSRFTAWEWTIRLKASQGNSSGKIDDSNSFALVYDVIKNGNLPLAREKLKAIMDADPSNETA
jgi:hypothetical protein